MWQMWHRSHRADPEARILADAHYSRQSIGAAQLWCALAPWPRHRTSGAARMNASTALRVYLRLPRALDDARYRLKHDRTGYLAAYWRMVRLTRLQLRCEHRLRRICAEYDRLHHGAGRGTDARRNEKDA